MMPRINATISSAMEGSVLVSAAAVTAPGTDAAVTAGLATEDGTERLVMPDAAAEEDDDGLVADDDSDDGLVLLAAEPDAAPAAGAGCLLRRGVGTGPCGVRVGWSEKKKRMVY